MAQTQMVLDIQDFNCPICLELLEDPITIPCGHSYCQGCLWEYWVGNNDSETVSCPQCRESFTPMPILGKNILLAETVEWLRTNNRHQAASPATIVTSASPTSNVQPQRASAFRDESNRPQLASAHSATNILQFTPVSTATNIQPQRASALRDTNVRPQLASAHSVTNNLQQRAPVSTASNVQLQHASVFRDTNVQSQDGSTSIGMNVKWPRVLAMLFACIAFSVAVHGSLEFYRQGLFHVSIWGFSFIGSLLVLLVELCEWQSCVCVSWKNFPITFACFAFLLCLTVSITFALDFVKDLPFHVSYTYCIVSLVFSCFATVAYLMEVGISKVRPDTTRDGQAGYMTTVPGLLKVCEAFVGGIIFVFINNPNVYESHAAIKWCMAVYCICFIMSSMVIIVCVKNCSDCLTSCPTCFLSFYALLAVIMYLTATIIWPIYTFATLHGGRPSQCSSSLYLCPFDKLVVVSVLSGVNFLLYLVDLIFSVRQLVNLCQDD
ncbi:myeloid-associated differentiation marker homolog [Sardina pilchardus]|uniref:myeloid-associated differentiation marker homolog n=1 Tax=Sardina pilchardus TaxID=27697 RepID=UPI002E16775E